MRISALTLFNIGPMLLDNQTEMEVALDCHLNKINSEYENLRDRIRAICANLADNIQQNADVGIELF